MVSEGKVCVSSLFTVLFSPYELLLLTLMALWWHLWFQLNNLFGHLDQGLVNYEPRAKSGQPPGFAWPIFITFLNS